jgi:6-phosphofructokinase 1
VLTGGGDCPGLNAVIRSVVKCAIHDYKAEVVGIQDGFEGLIEGRSRLLDADAASGILTEGGTILGTSNKANPFQYYEEGSREPTNVVDRTMEYYNSLGLDGLIVVGGDGTLAIASRLMAAGAKIVGVPKTIDNDVNRTETTVGFDSAVNTATWAIDKLRSTAQSHHRVMVVEVMGRYAGWLALQSGLSGGGDIILIPEIEYDIQHVATAIEQRRAGGKQFSIVVVAEGAHPKGGEMVVSRRVEDSPDKIRLGGVGQAVSDNLAFITKMESRATKLGHIQRGGDTSAYDRLLGTRFGVEAVHSLFEGVLDVMIAKTRDGIVRVPISEIGDQPRLVDPDHEFIRAARSIGVSFGDQ